jgi:hypothetical protein
MTHTPARRRRLARRVTLAFVIAVLPWPAGVAQQRGGSRGTTAAVAVLAGRVVGENGEPLGGVVVGIAGAPKDLVTDDRGAFTVGLTAGTPLVISLRRLGYRAATHIVEVPPGDTTRLSFFLVPVAPVLDTVTVSADAPSESAKLDAFERRRQRHLGGTFITRSYIERRKAVETIDLLRGLLGVRVVDSAGVQLIASSRGVRPTLNGRADAAPCYMLVGVDGQLKSWGFDVNELSPKEIHGIEIYNGSATVPRDLMGLLQQGAFCGLVMIWTRADR